jgi:hypothetical protein
MHIGSPHSSPTVDPSNASSWCSELNVKSPAQPYQWALTPVPTCQGQGQGYFSQAFTLPLFLIHSFSSTSLLPTPPTTPNIHMQIYSFAFLFLCKEGEVLTLGTARGPVCLRHPLLLAAPLAHSCLVTGLTSTLDSVLWEVRKAGCLGNPRTALRPGRWESLLK